MMTNTQSFVSNASCYESRSLSFLYLELSLFWCVLASSSERHTTYAMSILYIWSFISLMIYMTNHSNVDLHTNFDQKPTCCRPDCKCMYPEFICMYIPILAIALKLMCMPLALKIDPTFQCICSSHLPLASEQNNVFWFRFKITIH